ncbi:hypothetical protein AGABI1DRAFT_130900 [Agaricus bisporus var. burnettii JB137-S8]|uniref:Uncharacterized protein n=1 Tax=Agaricus bisporus var. burnettii (strain JB137-S8 / ATCC MYA-4627 / FGSC 10392) TaxID=597362 RepID=K5XQ40_AGABU|nr:uncharacterized protein AGABI1DRAFT_130900 [Agaricus bisporus var. burnettii JB137-S8]EKM76885.1 hypothetical protein AGABI1DRAFT_130900 [Agaricus bisporus var. burnettii JB137-S8]
MGHSPGGEVLALMIGSVLYGLNLVTVWLSIQRLFRERGNWKRGLDINLPMAAVVIVLFMASTTNLALQVTLVMRNLSQSPPEDFLMERSRTIVAQAILLILETIIADGVLLFRCWTVWNKMILIIVLPLVLWVGCVCSSAYASYCLYRILLHPTPSAAPALSAKTYAASVAFWAATITVNIYCTGLIVGRICSVQQGWRPPSICSSQDIPQRGRLQLAKRIVIESAMMYTLSSLSAFISHICPYAEQEAQIIGIAFNLILIRPWSQKQDHESELCVRGSEPKTKRSTVSVAVGTTDSLVDIP